MHTIHTLDLNFLNRKEAIAVYLIRHQKGAVLVETGPGSTLPVLLENMAHLGFSPKDITHVLLTHIHLDHAGAVGWFASQGAEVLVHPVGKPHMADPDKLLASAKRIYQDRMESLWGDFLPVSEENLVAVNDREVIRINDLEFTALHTPGHAEHHISWLFEEVCFTGDVGGVRMPGVFYIRLPMVPPELNIEKWRQSLVLLDELDFPRIAPTHYGIYNVAHEHLSIALNILNENEDWISKNFQEDKPIEVLREEYVQFLYKQGIRMGVSEETLKTSEVADPSWMGADGLSRYWKKFRTA
ncbi:MAG TPA: MBL fold metallo-hydrolase [Anaerolineales bacterium]|nr:MBL fold metallo-hydrolase [Anaerolineales bacterium]